MTSQEELTAMTPRHPLVITIKSGVKRDGTLIARDIFIVFNSGAYGAFRPNVMDGMLPGSARRAHSTTRESTRRRAHGLHQ